MGAVISALATVESMGYSLPMPTFDGNLFCVGMLIGAGLAGIYGVFYLVKLFVKANTV